MLTELEENQKKEKEQKEKEQKEKEEREKLEKEQKEMEEKLQKEKEEEELKKKSIEENTTTTEEKKENEVEMNVNINDISGIEETEDQMENEANASFSDNNNNSPNQMEIEKTTNNNNNEESDDDDDNNIVNNGLNSTASSLFDPDETLGFDEEEIPINNEKLTNKVMKITNFMTPTKDNRDSFSYSENYTSESINSSQKPTRLFNSSELSPINTPSYSSMKGSVVMIDEIPLTKRKRELLVDDIASTIFSPVRRSVRLNHSPVPVSPHLFDVYLLLLFI